MKDRFIPEGYQTVASDILTGVEVFAGGSPDKLYAIAYRGKKTNPDHALRDLDRIEICRALTVDPKVARRERFQKQGSSRAGLFSKRRAGAKPGY